jgi:hypothetical protein
VKPAQRAWQTLAAGLSPLAILAGNFSALNQIGY